MSQTTLPNPSCICLALCNEIIEDVRSRSKSVIGIFNSVGTSQIPTVFPRLSLLASVTNAAPETPIRIVILTPTGQELLSADGKTLTGDHTSVTDFPLEVQGVMFPEVGVYSVNLHAAGDLIAQRFFTVFIQPALQPPAQAA